MAVARRGRGRRRGWRSMEEGGWPLGRPGGHGRGCRRGRGPNVLHKIIAGATKDSRENQTKIRPKKPVNHHCRAHVPGPAPVSSAAASRRQLSRQHHHGLALLVVCGSLHTKPLPRTIHSHQDAIAIHMLPAACSAAASQRCTVPTRILQGCPRAVVFSTLCLLLASAWRKGRFFYWGRDCTWRRKAWEDDGCE